MKTGKNPFDFEDNSSEVKEEKQDLTKENVKEEIKEQVEERQAEREPVVLMSSVDAYVHERMKSQPKDIHDLEVSEKKTPNKHRLSVPDEFESYKSKFTFKWIFKHPRAISHACDVRGWTLVNRTLFPEIAKKSKYLFTASGAVERGDLLLACITNKKAQEIREAPGKMSKEIISTTLNKHKGDPNFYKPTDQEDKQNVVMI